MGVLVEVVDAVGIEQRGAAFDAVDLLALRQQALLKIGAVLAGDAGDECSFHKGQDVVEPTARLTI